jgi:hypothetical protein
MFFDTDILRAVCAEELLVSRIHEGTAMLCVGPLTRVAF